MECKIIFMILVILIMHSVSNVHKFKFYSTNILYVNDVLKSLFNIGKSNIHCAKICTEYNCQSYAYHAGERFCRLYKSTSPNTGKGTVYTGVKFYKRKYENDVTAVLNVSNGERWGNWGKIVFCPSKTYGIGYNIKFEQYQGARADDSSLNNIGILCSWQNQSQTTIFGEADYKKSLGIWLGPNTCKSGEYLTTFRTRVEVYDGKIDNTASNSIKFKCRPFEGGVSTDLPTYPGLEGNWGDWGEWSDECAPRTAICGIQIKYEDLSSGVDNTAMNDVNFLCCK